MKTLESLVPPLDLCKKIPKGEFADSVLVYGNPKGWSPCLYPQLVTREECNDPDKTIAPAPTLVEIMLALDEAGYWCPTCYYQAGTWHMDCEDDDPAVPAPAIMDAKDKYNPATVALRLWLELNKGETSECQN